MECRGTGIQREQIIVWRPWEVIWEPSGKEFGKCKRKKGQGTLKEWEGETTEVKRAMPCENTTICPMGRSTMKFSLCVCVPVNFTCRANKPDAGRLVTPGIALTPSQKTVVIGSWGENPVEYVWQFVSYMMDFFKKMPASRIFSSQV